MGPSPSASFDDGDGGRTPVCFVVGDTGRSLAILGEFRISLERSLVDGDRGRAGGSFDEGD
jgi:hypothetical protein